MRIKLPGHKQKHPYTCLPASIKITLDYLGHEISEEEVERFVRRRKLELCLAMLWQASRPWDTMHSHLRAEL